MSDTPSNAELETSAAPSSAQPGVIDAKLYDRIEDALRDVADPELDINIVDLGLIYDLTLDEDAVLTISMTLTSAGCPLTEMLESDIGTALDGIVEKYRINWVWMPPWTPDRITDEGRDMMRALGFAM